MPTDVIGAIERFEANDTQQLTLTATLTVPQTVAFHVFNTDGATLSPSVVQSGLTVSQSGASTGLFYVNKVMPDSVGLYAYQWTAWDSSSLTYIVRREFQIIRTEPFSFSTYADMADVVRTGRQMFGRADITLRDLQPYAQAADEYIDARLQGTGVDTVLLREMSKTGALYYYYSDRYAIERQEAPPAITERWSEYKELMGMIVAGTAGTRPSVGIMTGGTAGAIIKPVFDMRDPINQRVDPDLITSDNDRDD